MATLVLRNIKGSPLSNTEADNNFQYLNNALGANGSTVVPTPSGTGSPVLTNNATLTAPTLSNATLTAPSITSATLVSPALGTPTSGVLTNCTGLPASSIIAATGITTWLTIPTSANFLGAITDGVGTGFLTFNNNTTFTGTTTIASLTVNSTVSGTGFTNYFASPPAIGSTSANTGVFTNLSYTGTLTSSTGIVNIGSGQIYKDASGNVGIGTTSPTQKLDVYNGLIRVGGSVQGKLLGFSSTNTQILDFGVSTGTGNGNDIGLYNISATGIIGVGTNSIERMRIDSSGNVGIGTTTPSTFPAKLGVWGYVTSGAQNYSAGFSDGINSTFRIGHTSGYSNLISDAGLSFYTSNTTRLNISATGDVGIGTSSPTAKLHVSGDIKATGDIIAFSTSDKKYKENILDIPNCLDKVVNIGSKYFDWTDEYLEKQGGEDGYFLTKSSFGQIAQTVQQVFPEGVKTRPDGTLAIDPKIYILAFGAIAELLERIKILESK